MPASFGRSSLNARPTSTTATRSEAGSIAINSSVVAAFGDAFGVALVLAVPLARPGPADCAFAPSAVAATKLKTSARLKKLRIKYLHTQWRTSHRHVDVFL